LTPNDHYNGRTAPLTSNRFILYIYSTNIGTEYFKHGIHSPCFSLQNAVCFIILTYLVPVLFTVYIQGVLKLKKNNPGAKRLKMGPMGRPETSVNTDSRCVTYQKREIEGLIHTEAKVLNRGRNCASPVSKLVVSSDL
jgi:hypothetical protein